MSKDLENFIELCLKNTSELSNTFEQNGEIVQQMCVDFTHRYIKEVAEQFGYKK